MSVSLTYVQILENVESFFKGQMTAACLFAKRDLSEVYQCFESAKQRFDLLNANATFPLRQKLMNRDCFLHNRDHFPPAFRLAGELEAFQSILDTAPQSFEIDSLKPGLFDAVAASWISLIDTSLTEFRVAEDVSWKSEKCRQFIRVDLVPICATDAIAQCKRDLAHCLGGAITGELDLIDSARAIESEKPPVLVLPHAIRDAA